MMAEKHSKDTDDSRTIIARVTGIAADARVASGNVDARLICGERSLILEIPPQIAKDIGKSLVEAANRALREKPND
jgi:hypothetical protein